MLCKYNFALCKLCPGPQAYVAQVIVAVRYLTMSKRSRSHIQGMADAIVDGFQRWLDEFQRHLDDEQDQSDIRRVYKQCIQALYRRAALMEERKESQSRACKLSKMRNNFPNNTLKHKRSPGKKRLKHRVPEIPRPGEPGEMPADLVKKASPPGFQISHVHCSGRWTLKADNFYISRSWRKYGHIEAGVLVLATAWERYMKLYGLTYCPIEGLMEKAQAIETNTESRMAYSSFAHSTLGKALSAHTKVACSFRSSSSVSRFSEAASDISEQAAALYLSAVSSDSD